jgi:sec-independent protein translocase protein TatB
MAHLSGGVVALLDTLTFPETITILVIALIVLGPEKLPGMARSIGTWMNKLKKMSANLQAEVREVMDDPQMQPLRELGEFAAQPKKKLAEYAMAAEAEVDRADAVAVPSPLEEVPAVAHGEVVPEADASDADATPVDATPVELDSTPADPTHADPAPVAETIDPRPVTPPDPEPVRKVVATGPNHPMERQSPEPHALES